MILHPRSCEDLEGIIKTFVNLHALVSSWQTGHQTNRNLGFFHHEVAKRPEEARSTKI
jgi:hypothetical protein